MERKISDKNVLERFAEEFCSVIEKHCRYLVCSGFVAIASGRTRGTEDIDMIIERLSEEKFILLHNELVTAGFECVQSSDSKELYEYLVNNEGLRYVWAGRDLFPPEMEVHFSKDRLDDFQLETRQKIEFVGVDIWFSSIDMNIAFKEELLKSDKDIEDANHLRRVYKDSISEQNINKIKLMIQEFRMKK